ncbi:MAG TPA: hypothetical protein VK569_11220, partial [Bacteroidota bacterium]|nr:hypothetical protein [Bacteroidota bacterium]
SAQKKGSEAPAFGSVWFTATLDIDRDDRTAEIDEIHVDRVKFPNSTPEQEKNLSEFLEDEIPDLDLELSLDRILAAIDQSQFQMKSAEALKNDPPKIIVMTQPAILITIDGNPQTRKIKDTELERVFNTTFPIVYDPDDKEYFFYGTSVWFTTEDLISGEWEYIKSPPSEVEDLFKEKPDNAKTKPPADEKAASPEELKKAKIVVATVPAELIVCIGEPNLAPIAGDHLMYVTNTESDVFLDIDLQKYFLLLSGRWFSSPSLKDGPWSYVHPDSLPKVFAEIREQSPKGEVLSHVPGTPQAKEAFYDAQMPQTAAIQRSEAKLEVTYDGEPQFKPIEGTSMSYAVNTATQVLLIGGGYYACDQGAWYVAPSAKGPWKISDTRPAQIDSIPPSSPMYNTKYVYVYESTPEVVYVGYTPAYTGCYPYYGTVVYGTGFYYPPYVSPYYYYPHPVTYGVSVHYSPYTGWGVGMAWSVGFVAMSSGWAGYGHGYSHGYNAGFWAGYHAGTRPGGVYGPGGYNPRPPNAGNRPGNRPSTQPAGKPSTQPANRAAAQPATRQSNNIYNRPENRSRNSASTQPANRQAPTAAQGKANNVYSDRNGDVYRQTSDGWQQRQGNNWSNSKPQTNQQPSNANRSAQQSSLNRDAQARQRGAQRSQGYQGGGMRGGGGRRR